jgi:hypothetical protein
MSILLFIRRLSSPHDKTLRRLIGLTQILIAVSFIGSVLTSTFNCKPLAATWSLNVRIYEHFTCASLWVSLVVWAIIFAITDLWLILLPMQIVWNLKIPRLTRIGILFVFGCGFVATIAAIVKAAELRYAYDTFDPTWSFGGILISSQLELCFGLISASLPALNMWLVRLIPKSWWPSENSTSALPESDPSKGRTKNWQDSTTDYSKPQASSLADNMSESVYPKSWASTETTGDDNHHHKVRRKIFEAQHALDATQLDQISEESIDLVIQAPVHPHMNRRFHE